MNIVFILTILLKHFVFSVCILMFHFHYECITVDFYLFIFYFFKKIKDKRKFFIVVIHIMSHAVLSIELGKIDNWEIKFKYSLSCEYSMQTENLHAVQSAQYNLGCFVF